MLDFRQYKFEYYNKFPAFITEYEAADLKMVAEGKTEKCAPTNIKRLEEYGFIRKNGSEYEPTIVIFKEGGTNDYLNNFSESEKSELSHLAEEIRAELKEAADFINKVIYNDLPASLKNDERMYKFACINGFGREYVCDRAIADGWLHYDADTKDAVGAYMYI